MLAPWGFTVSITLSATVANPEPGTFALAAIGLLPLCARYVRRRAHSG